MKTLNIYLTDYIPLFALDKGVNKCIYGNFSFYLSTTAEKHNFHLCLPFETPSRQRITN